MDVRAVWLLLLVFGFFGTSFAFQNEKDGKEELEPETGDSIVQAYLDAYDNLVAYEESLPEGIMLGDEEIEDLMREVNALKALLPSSGLSKEALSRILLETSNGDALKYRRKTSRYQTNLTSFLQSPFGHFDKAEDEKPLQRHRRAIESDEKYRWPKAILPYRFMDSITEKMKPEIHRAMKTYERLTCVRFTHWTKEDGVTTNDRLQLGHKGHLQFIASGGCWAIQGRRENGQSISCCGKETCVHELGHSLGLSHEHATPDPDRDMFIRINPQFITAGGQNNYRRDSNKHTQGYDFSSYMHYTNWMFNNKLGKTFTALFPEIRIHTSFYYMMREVSMAHNCEGQFCAGKVINCDNDGYFSVVDDECQCKCIPGLDPAEGCTKPYSNSYQVESFPGGNYATLEPDGAGCADSRSTQGTWTQYNNGGNTFYMSDIAGQFTSNKVKLQFCVSRLGDTVQKAWQVGSYCVFRVGGQCPEGFEEGYVQFADKDGNHNGNTGDLPDGTFGADTRYEFCCRGDGFDYVPIHLPTEKPFVLGKHPERDCQKVLGMHESVRKYTYRNINEGLAAVNGTTPVTDSRTLFYNLQFCYYTKADMDCGGIFELNTINNEITISSPRGRSELECTWLIKAPKGKSLIMKFTEFNIKGTYPDSCEDELEIRYFRKGQPGFIYCGTQMDKTFRSFNDTFYLRLSTFGRTDSRFEATVTLINEEELPYVVADRGISYVGKVNFTRSFVPCLPWKDVPHCNYHPGKSEHDGNVLLEENYCRNPDYTTGMMPWCYTDPVECKRDYCDVGLLGDYYDSASDCAERKRLGLCDTKYLRQAWSQCAKTCASNLPPVMAESSVSGVTCPAPVPSPDGKLLGPIKSTYFVGDKVTYQCLNSAVQRESTCLTNGQWSPIGLTCGRCQLGWTFNAQHVECLKHFDTATTITEAANICVANNATLKLIDSAEDNERLRRIISINVWATEPSFQRNSTYSNWKDGKEPLPTDVNTCGVLQTDGLWAKVDCRIRKSRFFCKKKTLDYYVCNDFSSMCTELLKIYPTMCTDFPENAYEKCPLSCGKCRLSGIKLKTGCLAPTPLDNAIKTNTQDWIPIGQTAEFSCAPGYVAISGDHNRTCLINGQMTGEDLVCVTGCPSGWSYLAETDSCYFKAKTHDTVTYSVASATCVGLNGTLASPKTPVQQAFLRNEIEDIGESVWVGLDNIRDRTPYRWKDGEPLLGWTNWPTEPQYNTHNDVRCVETTLSNVWERSDCSSQHSYVCQSPRTALYLAPSTTAATTPAPDTTTADTGPNCCPEGWVFCKETSSCLHHFAEIVDHGTASKNCEKLNGYLAMPKNEALTQALRVSLGSSADSWIGLADIQHDGSFEWEDGTSLNGWANWKSASETRAGNTDDCVAVTKDGAWTGSPCDAGKTYVCEIPLEVCPTGWRYLQETCSCYLLYEENVPYFIARYKCEDNMHGVLATPKTDLQNNFILDMITVNTWIGLDDLDQEGQFKWVDGEPLGSVTHWSPGEPTNNGGNENCVHYGINKLWNDLVCSYPMNYVCQVSLFNTIRYSVVDTSAATCPSEWIPLDESKACYRRFDDRVNHTEASQHCRDVGGYLAMPKTPAQQQVIIDAIGSQIDHYWMGLNDMEAESVFKWDDGTPLNGWTNWNKNEPNNVKEEDCVSLLPFGLWNDWYCYWPMRYVCQVPLPKQCPSGWLFLEETNACYKEFHTKVTFANAETQCKSLNGSLAMPKTMKQNYIFLKATNFSSQNTWMGMTDRETEGVYKWLDGEVLSSPTNWQYGEPNNNNGVENCIHMTPNMQWSDTHCNVAIYYVCQVPVDALHFRP